MSTTADPNPPADRPRLAGFWRAETGIFLALWLGLTAADPARFFQDPGTFWHVAVGRRILDAGEFIRAEPFSFTRAGEPWVATQWVGQCLMAILYAVGGFDALLLGTTVLIAGLFTWIAHRLMAAGLHWSLSMVLALGGVAVSANHFHVRPHLGTMVLFAVVFARLVDFEAGRVGVRGLFWLLPWLVLWVNVHGGYLGGLGTIGLAVAGWGGLYLLGKDPGQARGYINGPGTMAWLV